LKTEISIGKRRLGWQLGRLGSGDHGLAEGKSAIVGGHLVMGEDGEAEGLQALFRLGGEDLIVKHAAG
jgi:hypothetical protein